MFVIAGKISDGEEFLFKFGILILYQDFMCFHMIHMLGYILLNKQEIINWLFFNNWLLVMNFGTRNSSKP